ncbi:hypothetical protein [Bacillus chungangensis]|uniref:Uncharacterized protein n=1 Tax=Bacillus chungangensis TaxID=587633 RepID=A0ABT9WP40_9BACI|nr:hypothetical protein [Bacillus chungangensis]MDQ0175048.1 hypothetical protein [Bacillus chungangensis]
MKNERYIGHNRDRHHRGDGIKRKDHNSRQRGAKTFRRGRAITFLERMNLKRSTLKKQLETQELQSIHPLLVGELKAIEMVINEFVQLFELYEFEEIEKENKKKEIFSLDSDEEKKMTNSSELYLKRG